MHSRLLSPLFAGLLALLFLVAATTAADIVEKREEKEEPFKNEVFHDTYMAKDEAVITPRTHPYLFSFTGRWLRRRDVFQASSWPGTSVTVLIYGQSCRIKVQAPVKSGIVDGQTFVATVDNGPQLLLTLPSYNATENPVFELNIDLPEVDNTIEEGAKENNVLIPHIVELVSEPSHPIRLVGVIMQNTLIQQGRDWLRRQDLIPTIEYISDRPKDSLPLNQTAVYHVARQLGLRQDYIVQSDICFSAECSRKRAGLAEQYTFFTPFNGNPRPQDSKEPMPNRYVFHRDDPLMKVKEPEFVIVDVGDNDLAHDVDGLEFMKSLQQFLGNLIVNARPDSEIFVLIRTGRYVTETEDAIISMRHAKLHAVKFGADTMEWYKSFYCSYVIPLGDSSYPYRELCGTAYEQLTAGSHINFAALLKGLFLFTFVTGALVSLYVKRRTIVTYVNEVRGYGKLPQTES